MSVVYWCAPTGSRIQAWVADRCLIDTREAVLLRGSASDLVYGVSPELLAATVEPIPDPGGVTAQERLDLVVDGERLPNSAFRFTERPAGMAAAYDDYVFVDFGAMDTWYEEDERLIGHPRDPFTRIDVRRSSRRITVGAGGETIADTVRPLLLFETGLPVRYYIPWADVRTAVLRPSDTTSVCCYKGRARYWHIETTAGRWPDAVWAYTDPLDDGERIRDAACFYQTALDLYLDGEHEQRAPRYFTR